MFGKERALVTFYFKKKRFYFFIFRGEGREKERERNDVREKHRSVASCLYLEREPNLQLQPRNVPQLGIEPVTFPLLDDAQSTKPHQSGLLVTF